MKHYLAIFILFVSTSAQAFEWSDLWLNEHQKGQKLLQEKPAEAAEKFQDSQWQGVANYNAGNFQGAVENFSEADNSASEYNLGNALAKAGDLEKSVQSYDDLLEKPDLPELLREDARFNRDLVKRLMEQQEQQQSQQNSDDSDESGESQESQDGEQEGQQDQAQNDSQQSQSEQGQGESKQEEQSDAEQAGDEELEPQEQQGNKSDEEKPTPKSEQSEEQREGQARANQDQPMTEDQQATEQWLRQIPDDPSGLLRRKLTHSHRMKYPEVQSGGQAW